MHHDMKLQAGPFDEIRAGSKVIELRLYDEKRQAVGLGDMIRFTKEPDQVESLDASVTGLLHYATFAQLVDDFPVRYFGAGDRTSLLTALRRFYSTADETKYGVLGIKIGLLPK